MELTNELRRVGYKRSIFLSIILISLGVVLINTLSLPSIGVVFIAVGGLFFIIGLANKTKEDANKSA